MIEALLKLEYEDEDTVNFLYENDKFTNIDLIIESDRWRELGEPRHVVITIRPYFEGGLDD